eukprot:3859364-Karenia_brevis.AAC.1
MLHAEAQYPPYPSAPLHQAAKEESHCCPCELKQLIEEYDVAEDVMEKPVRQNLSLTKWTRWVVMSALPC